MGRKPMGYRSFLVLIVLVMFQCGEGQLFQDFYSLTCPDVGAIVEQAVINNFREAPRTIPATLRLFFHDCMVTGCDASIMVDSPDGDAERYADDNLSLAQEGFETIIRAKADVEEQCPGVVSCADIMALAARDAVSLAGGPSWAVELGRRDGLISQASLVQGNLPEPEFSLEQLDAVFGKHGLSQSDMVTLSGAHTIGSSHCIRFAQRLYSFSDRSPYDPIYAEELMSECPQIVDPNVIVAMDPTTPQAFDNVYYQNVLNGQGLFTSDAALLTGSLSSSTVIDFANNRVNFNRAFASAMIKLGRVGVKTGDEGRIRTDCTDISS